MRKTVIYCDRCGREIENVFHLTVTQERVDIGDEITAPAMKSIHALDFCFDCMVGIQDFALSTPCEAPEADPEPVPEPATALCMLEVDKSAAVDTPPEEPGAPDDTPEDDSEPEEMTDEPHKNAPGKLAAVPNEFFRSLASIGMSSERIRAEVAQEFGITCTAQAIRNRLHKTGL